MRSQCRRCGRQSYGFPLCSWCRRRANEGRVVRGRVAVWSSRCKVFGLVSVDRFKSMCAQRRCSHV